MSYVEYEQIGRCVSIRLVASETNALTTEFMKAITAAVTDAESEAKGILLCGGR